jgi:hypothetical protein
MDFMGKAKGLGKWAGEKSSKAYKATRDGGSRLKAKVSDTVSGQVGESGFSRLSRQALDKSADTMLATSLRVLNLVIRKLAKEPNFVLVAGPAQLADLKNDVMSNGTEWDEYTEVDLVKLRTLFTNSFDTLDLGSEINDFLNSKHASRVEDIKAKLKDQNDSRGLSDPQVMKVLQKMWAEQEDLGSVDDEKLDSLILAILSEEQHYYTKVYEGLKTYRDGDVQAAGAVLASIEAAPHYLVHKVLAESRDPNDVDAVRRDVEASRMCRPADAELFDDRYAFGDSELEAVLCECRTVLAGE